MYITFQYSKRIFEGQLIYIRKESSFLYDPWKASEISVMLGETCIGVDVLLNTGELVQISGFSPCRQWTKASLSMPQAKTGYVFMKGIEPQIEGICIEYPGEWPIFFDKTSKVICFGNPIIDDVCNAIQFSRDIVAIERRSILYAIWAKIDLK